MDVYDFIDVVKDRNKHNKNALVVFVGDTGSGKSWGTISMCEEIDPNFNIDRIYFDPEDFIRDIVDSIDGKKIIPTGSCLMVEEAGELFSNREWQSINNKIISVVAQSFRSFIWNIFFTLPNFDYFDKQAREQTHFYFETFKEGIDYVENTCRFKIRELKKDHFTGDIKRIMPRDTVDGGEIVFINDITIPKPANEKLIAEYEIKKKEWQKKTAKELLDLLQKKRYGIQKVDVPDVSISPDSNE